MGFYSDNNENQERAGKSRQGWSKAAGWVATVVLSALVGSGTTIFALSKELPSSTASPAAAPSSSTPSSSTATLTTTNVQVNDPTVQIVQKVKPAVMGVVNYTKQTNVFSQQSSLQATGVGSGVLFYKDSKYGYLVTNHHVVVGAAKVEVVTSKGVHIKADVVGSDPFTDLAVVRIPVAQVKNVSPVPFANSSNIQAGQQVVAIGNPEGLAFQDSVTSGIISATQRTMPVETESNQTLDYQSVIQTDAAINPGNSGGPLLNMKGQIIGINSSKIVAQGVNNMGFAIPSNEVQKIADELMKTGHAVHSELGIDGYSLSQVPQQMLTGVPVNSGVYVYSVLSAGAKQGGLKKGDVIISIDGHQVANNADLRTYVFEKSPGQTVTLQVYRGSQKKTIKVTLEKYQQQATTQSSSQSSSQSGSSSSPQDNLNPFSGSGVFGG